MEPVYSAVKISLPTGEFPGKDCMARRRKPLPVDQAFSRGIVRWMGFGFTLCFVIGFFVYIGYLLDKKMGNENPDLVILGFFVGLALMIYVFIRNVQLSQKELDTPPDDEDEEDM
ncbi:MAG: AtpZ/AtpI family protein [Planctomycetota bacterium]|jgi:phosphotransferase system  glucose/maltose/N-acetylglucosamine-specific IIC component